MYRASHITRRQRGTRAQITARREGLLRIVAAIRPITSVGDRSVELDAIEPDALRNLVREVIARHLPQDQLRVLMAAEESERTLLRRLIDSVLT